MTQRLPNFLYLGPGKSGSTWLHEVLISHPEIYFTEAKDLYFFSRYYDRGVEWYGQQFRGAGPEHKIVGEVSPEYLSRPEAAERIRECLGPDVRLMMTLREPAARAFSSYLYLQKHGLAAPTFIQTAQQEPDLLNEGRYATHLRRFLGKFGRESLHVALFDDLEADPQKFLDQVTDWLGVDRHAVSPEQLDVRLPASRARWLPLAAAAGRAANWVRSRDGADLVGRIKRSGLVQRVLYQPLGDEKPAMSAEDVAYVRDRLSQEIADVEHEIGVDLRRRWGWQ
jgi:Sulfotransferase domain